MNAAPMTTFGKYEIVRKLGRSMTDVYLAHDPVEKRPVVLKLIEQCADAYTGIVIEAERRGAAIQHQLHTRDKRILEVYEYGEQNGCFFVAMQYVEGISLAALLEERQRLDPVTAARYAEEAASQLATLHSFELDLDGRKQAVVHGDIKPSNIQTGGNGELWLLDFGIAKAITATRNLTNHNLGSPAYCSPERLRRGIVDPHADLWALGVCLHEMIAGLPPYHAQSTRKLENLIQSRKPPRALPDSCPAALRAIIRKALAADLEHRYASAREFQQDLRTFLDGGKTAAESQPSAAWDSNATLERPRPDGPAHGQTVKVRRGFARLAIEHRGLAASLLAGIAVGLVCFLPAVALHNFWREGEPLRARRDYHRASIAEIESDHARLRSLERAGGLARAFNLVEPLRRKMHDRLISTGDGVLARYRVGTDPEAANYDWAKARLCYQRAVELTPEDGETSGKRALCDGYLALLRGDARGAEAAFRDSLRLLPSAPDAHLGLARLAIYEFHNAGQAMAAFHAAERLGFKSGPREMAQQGDAYLYRAEQQVQAARAAPPDGRRRMLAQAQRDFERARSLLEPIAGYSNVDDRLVHLSELEAAGARLAEIRPVARTRRPAGRYARRWR